jgi:hypothetical protein
MTAPERDWQCRTGTQQPGFMFRDKKKRRSSTLRVDIGVPLRPEDYARLVIGVWAMLMLTGHEQHATIEPDGSATAEQIEEWLDRLIQTAPWGW